MRLRDALFLSMSNLRAHVMRSALTVIGLGIGIGAIIAVFSIGRSGQAEIARQLDRFGMNRIWIAGSEQAALREDDVRVVASLAPAGSTISGMRMARDEVRGDQTAVADVVGCNATYGDIVDLQPVEGRFLRASDERSSSRVAVLDKGLADAVFGGARAVGRTVRVAGKRLSIIGVVEAPSMPYAERATKGLIYLPLSAYEAVYGAGKLDQIQLTSTGEAQSTGEAIVRALERRRGVQNAYSATNMQAEANTASAIMDLFVAVLLCVALICMLVGGIGVMNVMLISVRERRREIGVIKAIGARRRQVMVQFWIESMLFSLAGGVVGVALAVVLSVAAAAYVDFPLVMDAGSVAVGVAFSLVIGWVFGMLPAMRAASLAPVEALRD